MRAAGSSLDSTRNAYQNACAIQLTLSELTAAALDNGARDNVIVIVAAYRLPGQGRDRER